MTDYNLHLKALNEYALIPLSCDKEKWILIEDIKSKFPSKLSDLVKGSSTNGWDLFKNSKNQTLDEVYRKEI